MKDVRDGDQQQKIDHPNIKDLNARALFKMLDPMGHGQVCSSSVLPILEIYN